MTRKFSKQERTQIYNLYMTEHKTLLEIRKVFKAGESSIKRVLQEEGAQIRPVGSGAGAAAAIR
jgi:hypothetical protein